MRLHPQVLQIGTDWGDGGHTKLYFLEGERKAIIDAGAKASPENDIAPYLAYFGYKLSDIDIILNTHGHFDHAEGNPSIPQAEVWMHPDDAFLVEDPPSAFMGFTGNTMLMMGNSEDRVAEARSKYVAACKTQHLSRRLTEGDIIDLGKGVQLRVVSLPGHTMGSVGYLWEKEGIFFTGDAAMGKGSRGGILPVLYHPFAYSSTLEKLLGMGVGVIAMAHYYETLRISADPIKRGKQIRMYLEDCREIHNRIMECTARAIQRNWQAPFPVVLADAIDLLCGKLNLLRLPQTGMPFNGARTISVYYTDIIKSL